MANTTKSPICILGMHRSGTSMVARLLNFCGLNLGSEEHLMAPNEANPFGYFEHEGFLEINEALLAYFGGSWVDPPKLKDGWERDPYLDEFRHRAASLVDTLSERPAWGWKDPRTTVLIPFWKSVIPNLCFVICVRSPVEVARSLEVRDGIPIGAGGHLWERYMKDSITDTAGCPRIFTFYQDYFADPLGETARVARFCGLGMPGDPSCLREAVSAELRHHKTVVNDLLSLKSVASENRLFYLCLCALLRDPTIPDGASPNAHDAHIGQSICAILHLLDELHDQETVPRLQRSLAEMEQQFASVRVRLNENMIRKEHEVSQLEQTVAQLQEAIVQLKAENNKLQMFVDNVRRTFAYRIYRQLVKPFARGKARVGN